MANAGSITTNKKISDAFCKPDGGRKRQQRKQIISSSTQHGLDFDVKTSEKSDYCQVKKSQAGDDHEDRSFSSNNFDLTKIYLYLLEGGNNYPSKVEITPPSIRINSVK